MWGENNTRLNLYLGAELQYPKILILYIVWLTCPDDSKKVWQLYVDFVLLTRSLLTLSMSVGLNSPLILSQYVVKWVGLVLRFFNNIWHLYVNLMLLEIDLLTLSMGVRLKLPLLLTKNVVRYVGLVLTLLKRYNSCM